MIVSYEDVGNWVDGISASSKDEFIFAIFVLNSENKLTNTREPYSLEEYVRKSEILIILLGETLVWVIITRELCQRYKRRLIVKFLRNFCRGRRYN